MADCWHGQILLSWGHDEGVTPLVRIRNCDAMCARFMRELPYGHDVLIENVLDPAHLHWAHSGVAKELSRHNAPQATMSASKPLDGAPGFLTVYKSCRRDSSDKQGESTSKEIATDIIYRAPGLIK